MNLGRMAGSMIGAFGGRAIGGALGGSTGRMVGSLLGSMVAGRGSAGIGSAMSGLGGLLGGGDDDEAVEIPDEEALLLIRAMTNAAKADGAVDDDEIAAIFSRAGDLDDDAQDFIRAELKAPLDLDEFINSVPGGMEADVYTASMLPIDVDTAAETEYLQNLADGLGLSGDDVAKIHEALGV